MRPELKEMRLVLNFQVWVVGGAGKEDADASLSGARHVDPSGCGCTRLP